MKLFKFVLVLAAFALTFACSSGDNTTNKSNNTANSNASAQSSPVAPPSPTATPDELAAARATYSATCVRCHKADGTGGEVELEDGHKLKVTNLREHGRRDSDNHLAQMISNGEGGMPAFKKRLSPEQIQDLVRFIRVEFHGQTPGATSGGNASNANAPARK